MNFIRLAGGGYQATREDGQVITIERNDHDGIIPPDMTWVCRYEDDHHGNNTSFAATKKHLIDFENNIII